jgi:hypothetical protein
MRTTSKKKRVQKRVQPIKSMGYIFALRVCTREKKKLTEYGAQHVFIRVTARSLCAYCFLLIFLSIFKKNGYTGTSIFIVYTNFRHNSPTLKRKNAQSFFVPVNCTRFFFTGTKMQVSCLTARKHRLYPFLKK